MPDRFCEVFRRRLAPLEPIPTGQQPVVGDLPGLRAVLFDVYGTLIISASGEVGITKQAACQTALAGALEAVGIGLAGSADPSVELLHRRIEASHDRSRAAGVDHPEVDVVEIWRQVLADMAAGGLIEPGAAGGVDPRRLAVEYEVRANPCWPMPHLRECLTGLREQGLLLGIVSNAQFYTPILLEALLDGPPEMWGFPADLQFYSYRLGRAKPGTALFERALEALRRRGIEPGEALYVGNDMFNDVFPAGKVGLRTALFAGDRRSLRRGEGLAQLEGVSPDLVVTDLAQLVKCIIV